MPLLWVAALPFGTEEEMILTHGPVSFGITGSINPTGCNTCGCTLKDLHRSVALVQAAIGFACVKFSENMLAS